MRFTMAHVLNEDIDSMRKYYPNIPEMDFMKFIELDPTYKGGNNAGTYARWILNLANKGMLDNPGHVKDILRRFDDNRKNLKEKDIMRFKSMDELEAYLNNDDSYKDLTHRQEVRGRQKDRRDVDLSKEARIVYEDDDWTVWVPETYAASCKLGQGTKWCTASTESSEYFDRYSKDGNLYILISKKDPKEKYQFHLESYQYMDINDINIDIVEFLVKYPGLLTFFGYSLKDGIMYENEKCEVIMGVTDEFRDKATSVTIPDSVRYIDPDAITACFNLVSIKFPPHIIEIGTGAFWGCESLKSVEISSPELRFIGNSAFAECNGIEEVRIETGNRSYIESQAFFGLPNLKTVDLGEGVTDIYDCAFEGCTNLKDVHLPKSVNIIGYSAFRDTGIETLTIPCSWVRIDGGAFKYCKHLKSVTFLGGSARIADTAFNGTDVTFRCYKNSDASEFARRNAIPVEYIDDSQTDGMDESLTLNEDIDAMRKYYPNIPEEDFLTYIGLDPTYQGGTQAGKYARWILNLANQSKIPLDDNSPISAKNRIPSSLEFFDSVRDRLKIKDIMRFKSLDELDEYTSSDDSYDEETQRQLVRHRQDARRKANLVQDAEIVYEDDDWVVYTPKTYAASCKLGQGTRWCTATTEDDSYFNRYTKRGPLYININKNNPTEKYQLHFESAQYMDTDDDDVSLKELFDQFPSLRKAYEPILQDLIRKSIESYQMDGGSFIVTAPKQGLANWMGGDVSQKTGLRILEDDYVSIADYIPYKPIRGSNTFYANMIAQSPEVTDLLEEFVKKTSAENFEKIKGMECDEEMVMFILKNYREVKDTADVSYEFAARVGTASNFVDSSIGKLLGNLPDWVSKADFTGEERAEMLKDNPPVRDKFYSLAESAFWIDYKGYSKAFFDLIQDDTVKVFVDVDGITSVPTAPIFAAFKKAKINEPEKAEWVDGKSDIVFMDNFADSIGQLLWDLENE